MPQNAAMATDVLPAYGNTEFFGKFIGKFSGKFFGKFPGKFFGNMAFFLSVPDFGSSLVANLPYHGEI